jgi:hypothetical protein
MLAFAEWLFGSEGGPDYFSFALSLLALSLLLPRLTPFRSQETIHRRHGLSITPRGLA